MSRSPFDGCEPCVYYCRSQFLHECQDLCDNPDLTPEEYQNCRKSCQASSNECVLQNCLDAGLCCEEVCAPPLTPCQSCKQNCNLDQKFCDDQCDPSSLDYFPCLTQCRYARSHCDLECYDNSSQCCDEACSQSRMGPLEQYRRNAMSRRPEQTFSQLRRPNQNFPQLRGLNQTYAPFRR